MSTYTDHLFALDESVILSFDISESDPEYQLCENITNAFLESGNEAILQELRNPFSFVGEKFALHATKKDMDTFHKVNKKIKDWYDQAVQYSDDAQRLHKEGKMQERNDAINNFETAKNAVNQLTKMNAILGKKIKSDGTLAYKWGKYGSMGLTAGAIGAGIYAVNKYRNAPKSVIGKRIAALRKIYNKWMRQAANGGPGIKAKLKQAAAKLLQVIDKLMGFMQKKAG